MSKRLPGVALGFAALRLTEHVIRITEGQALFQRAIGAVFEQLAGGPPCRLEGRERERRAETHASDTEVPEMPDTRRTRHGLMFTGPSIA